MNLIFILALIGMLWMCMCFIISIKFINRIVNERYTIYRLNRITLKGGILLVPIIIGNVVIIMINLLIWIGCIVMSFEPIIKYRFTQDFLISATLTVVGSHFSGVFGLEIGLATSTLISPIMWIMSWWSKKNTSKE